MDFALVFWFLILTAVVSVVLLFISASRVILITALCLVFVALCWISFWTWFLRDGLGPDMVQSSGVEAWKRFSEEMGFPLGICCFIGISAIGIYWWQCRKQNRIKTFP
jgi:hypothetical protein